MQRRWRLCCRARPVPWPRRRAGARRAASRSRRSTPGRDRQAGRPRLRHPHERRAHGSAHAGVPGRSRAAANGRRAYRRIRAIPGPRAADRLQRSAHQRRDARVAEQSQRSAAGRRLQLLRAQSRPRPRRHAALRVRQGAGGVRASGPHSRARGRRERAWRLGAARRRRACAAGSRPRRLPRRGLLPQRGHRSARRLQGVVCLRRDHRRRQAGRPAAGRCGAGARERSATSARCATLAGLQRTAPRSAQPSIAAAICLLDVNCSTHEGFIAETLAFADKNPGFQELLRGAAAGLGALAVAGHAESLDALFRIGIPATDEATRAPVALAVGAVALRNTALMLPWLEKAPNQAAALGARSPKASRCSRRISTRNGSSR